MKFKSDIDEDIYKETVSEYARVKNIGYALKVCQNYGDLQICHRPGGCKRSDKVDCKLTKEQLYKIKQFIN